MQIANIILLTLTVLLCGAYFGMTLFCQIGLLPAMRSIEPAAFIQTWRSIDGYMDRAMPPYKLTLLLLTATTTVTLYLTGQRHLAILTGISFLLGLIALVLTITRQVPVNKCIASLPPTAADSLARDLLRSTESNFTIRFVLAFAAFAALCIGVTHYPVH